MKKFKFVVVPLTVLALLALTVGVASAQGQTFRWLHHESQGQSDPSWTRCLPDDAWNGHQRHEDDWQGEVCDPDDGDDGGGEDGFCEESPNDPQCVPPPPPCRPNTAAAAGNCPPPPPPQCTYHCEVRPYCAPDGQVIYQYADDNSGYPPAIRDDVNQTYTCWARLCGPNGDEVIVTNQTDWNRYTSEGYFGPQVYDEGTQSYVCSQRPPEEAPPTGEFGFFSALWAWILSLLGL